MPNIQIDPSKSGLENLLAMVDAFNTNGPATPDEVSVSNLQAITPNGVLNTSVTLTGTNTGATHYTGSVTVEYGRLVLADEATNPSTPVEIPNGTTDPVVILGLVATHYGFVLADISWQANPTVPGAFPADTSETVQCSGSLVYQDGTASVNLHWD
jgi:hypothetical protein